MTLFSKIFKKKPSRDQAYPPQQFRPRTATTTQAQQRSAPRKRSGLPSGYLNKSVF